MAPVLSLVESVIQKEGVAKLMSLIDNRATREKSKKLLAVQGKFV